MQAKAKISKATMTIAWVVVFGAMAPLLDSTMINIAINNLVTSFHSSVTTVQWAVTGYLLATGSRCHFPVGYSIVLMVKRSLWLVRFCLVLARYLQP